MNSHWKGGLKTPPSKQDKVQHCKHIKGGKSPAPSLARSCEPKKQRTEEDDDSCASSNKKSKSRKKIDEELTVPQNDHVPQSSSSSTAKLSANLVQVAEPSTVLPIVNARMPN